jgi:hypothetical protein
MGLEWIKENGVVLQVVTSALMVAIWLVYLHLILLGFLRQRRSSVLINRAGRRDVKARCLISNMGAEPAYVLDVLAEIELSEGFFTASVIDWDEGEDDPPAHSHQGPLSGGEYMVIGTFRDLIERAEKQFGRDDFLGGAQSIFLIVLVSTNQARRTVAACRKFELRRNESKGRTDLLPLEIEAIQIRTGWRRRRLNGIVQDFERQEASRRSLHQSLFPHRWTRVPRYDRS